VPVISAHTFCGIRPLRSLSRSVEPTCATSRRSPGHKSIATTARYTQFTDAAVKRFGSGWA
jgi:hypothetical protein